VEREDKIKYRWSFE